MGNLVPTEVRRRSPVFFKNKGLNGDIRWDIRSAMWKRPCKTRMAVVLFLCGYHVEHAGTLP